MRTRTTLFVFILLTVLAPTSASSAQTSQRGAEFNKPVSQEARDQLDRAIALRSLEKTEEAVAALKKLIAAAPHYVEAHIAYIKTRDFFQGKYEEVKAEYEALLAKEPDNPVYPLVVADGLSFNLAGKTYEARLQKIADRFPAWAWGHYAKGRLLLRQNPAEAAAEFAKCIEKDSSAYSAYLLLSNLQERRLDRPDEAISTAEKMQSLPGDFHMRGKYLVWRLRYANAPTEEAKTKLRRELQREIEAARDAATVAGYSQVLRQIFRDVEAAQKLQDKALQLDPAWYGQRGKSHALIISFEYEPTAILKCANRDSETSHRLSDIPADADVRKKMEGLEKALASKPVPGLAWYLNKELFELARSIEDVPAMVKYGEAAHALDPSRLYVSIQLALALAKSNKELGRAFRWASQAEAATAEFRPFTRPANLDPDFFNQQYPLDKQREMYRKRRAAVLDALGWVLHRQGKFVAAEARLRESVNLDRKEENLTHLASALSKLGRAEEAKAVALEAENLLLTAVRKKLAGERQPVRDFTLTTVDGRQVSLAELKGKVVLLNFWATWCGPCIAELPQLIGLYEKYKRRGAEVLAISIDNKDDRQAVIDFAKERNLPFPALFDDGVAAQFRITAIPANLFIDKQGNLGYRLVGLGKDTLRSAEIVIDELLK